MKSNEYISIGMYSLNHELQSAWESLFLLATEMNPTLNLPRKFLNSVDDAIITSTDNRLSHICGYPLVERFAGKFQPLCAPYFDIDGYKGAEYFSHFLVRQDQDSGINSIPDSKGFIAAINSLDSNSGMSVLRHEVEKVRGLGAIENFFKSLHISGSHANSIRSIVDGDADIASVDASTYYYLKKIKPELEDQLKIVGRSIKTPSPPLVTHTSNPLCAPSELADALNGSLLALTDELKELLNIKKFLVVNYSDYEYMIDL